MELARREGVRLTVRRPGAVRIPSRRGLSPRKPGEWQEHKPIVETAQAISQSKAAFMRFNQDKMDELMRLLKQAHELFADNFDSEGDFDADAEDERAMLAIAMAGKSIRHAIEHLAPISIEPGLPAPEPDKRGG
jgi:hypothetical protein